MCTVLRLVPAAAGTGSAPIPGSARTARPGSAFRVPAAAAAGSGEPLPQSPQLPGSVRLFLSLQQHGNNQHESLPRPGQSCSVPSLASHLTATEYERSLLSVGQPLHLSQTPPRISGSILLQQLKSARICNQVSNFQYQSMHAETFGYKLVSLKNLLQRLRIWQEA